MNWCRTRNVTFFSRSIAVSKISGWYVIPPVMETKRSRPGRECGVSLQLRVFRAEAKHFSRAKASCACYALVGTWAVLIFTPVVDSIPNRNLHRPSSVENFFRVIAPSSNVWILFIPSEIFVSGNFIS